MMEKELAAVIATAAAAWPAHASNLPTRLPIRGGGSIPVANNGAVGCVPVCSF